MKKLDTESLRRNEKMFKKDIKSEKLAVVLFRNDLITFEQMKYVFDV